MNTATNRRAEIWPMVILLVAVALFLLAARWIGRARGEIAPR